jgi:hypothetical protein
MTPTIPQHPATATHTPTPWRLDNPYRPERGTAWRDIVSDHAEFSPCYVGEACGEDAALIVRAVNSHAELVAALSAMYCAGFWTADSLAGLPKHQREAVESARSALAAAQQ